jgi:LacI family transcriptional regulator
MALTLEKIARLAGVSRSTVSRVVNDDPNVRDEVRQRIWKVIRETGYQPHAAARSLVTRRTQIIGVIIPESVTTLFTDPFFPLLLNGVTAACNKNRYHLMLSLFDGSEGPDGMYQRVLRSAYLDGVIVASATVEDPLIPRLLRDDVPFVLVGRHPDKRVTYVDVDNVGGARMATEHLIRLGHKRIATVAGPLDMLSAQDRLDGYRQALEAHGLPVDHALIAEGDYREGGGMAGAKKLLAASPTAIFVASDIMAIGALKALRQEGMEVPRDIAIASFDDLPIATAVQPALTTIRQPIDRLGPIAVQLLLDLVNCPLGSAVAPQRLLLPTELVIRGSCGVLQ